MSHLTRSFLALAVAIPVLLGTALVPRPAEAAAYEKCGKLGPSGKPIIDRIRAKRLSCDDATTLAAKWVETRVAGKGARTIDGYRCPSRVIRRGVVGVSCSEIDGPAVVKFRYLKKNR